MIWFLSAAVFDLTLGISFATSMYALARLEGFLVRPKAAPDAIHFADQSNVIHADFRPGRWPLSQDGGEAA